MNRINRLLDKINQDEADEFRRVEVMVLRPKKDLGKLASEHELSLPKLLDMERGLQEKIAVALMRSLWLFLKKTISTYLFALVRKTQRSE